MNAYIVRNNEEFNFIDTHYLGSYFQHLEYDFEYLIQWQCDNIRQDLILYEHSMSDPDEHPGWDVYGESNIYYSDCKIIKASLLMRKPKIMKLCR